MRTLTGPLIYPDGSPMGNVQVFLRAQRVNWSGAGLVCKSVEQVIITNDIGEFAIAVAPGDYQVWVSLPETSARQHLGGIVVETGAAVELGELIELSRDASADWSISADWATRAWVNAQIVIGGVPYDIDVTALNPGAGTAGQLYRVAADELTIEPFTLQLKNYPLGNAIYKGILYEKPDGMIGTLPTPRVISASTTAVPGDELIIDMNAADADLTITLPAVWTVTDRPVSLEIVSDDNDLPYTVTIQRAGAQTIWGYFDDLQITRRRGMKLFRVGANDVRFN